jgi:aconitate hydratase
MQRNNERYQFLKWGQHAFSNFRAVPPGTGICHQVNLEYLAKGVWTKDIDGKTYAYPDTLVGTDSHTTMINGLGVLGWGVGGIEAEAAMLGQPISMLIPEVIGFRLDGKLKEGITATDLVLRVVQMLREKGVVGKFVEFFGPGLDELPLADRATLANMAPEYGATCGFFPIDNETIKYLELSGREQDTIDLVKAYCQAQGLWRDHNTPDPVFTDTLSLDMNSVVPSLAGPKRPQDRVPLSHMRETTVNVIIDNGNGKAAIEKYPCDDGMEMHESAAKEAVKTDLLNESFASADGFEMHHGDVVIAAITSCTNTSNPNVMLAAGLVAKKAIEKGIKVKPWVKTSLAPGSKVVTDYLVKTDLMKYLEQLGFYLVGYGCTTCIGNSGPLSDSVSKTVTENDLTVCSVLSGNRNFEGRIHPLVKANWLASPPLVVAFALAGTTKINLDKEPVAYDDKEQPIFLKDIWPTQQEVADAVAQINNDMFRKEYAGVFEGDEMWKSINITESDTYAWDSKSTYVKNPPFFEGMSATPSALKNIAKARVLAVLGDSVTTDHISPAGAIKPNSPAGEYLTKHNVAINDFNSYGSRRGNDDIMTRGTFGNIRIRNEMVPGTEGGFTKYLPTGEELSIYDAAMKYKADGTPLVVFAGKEYGTGSSRDWAAKGTLLLGAKAVIAESFERIHRSNLIGMGVLPLEFTQGKGRGDYKLDGSEIVDIDGVDALEPGKEVMVSITREDGSTERFPALCRIDTQNELEYYRNGGILQYVLRKLKDS